MRVFLIGQEDHATPSEFAPTIFRRAFLVTLADQLDLEADAAHELDDRPVQVAAAEEASAAGLCLARATSASAASSAPARATRTIARIHRRGDRSAEDAEQACALLLRATQALGECGSVLLALPRTTVQN